MKYIIYNNTTGKAWNDGVSTDTHKHGWDDVRNATLFNSIPEIKDLKSMGCWESQGFIEVKTILSLS